MRIEGKISTQKAGLMYTFFVISWEYLYFRLLRTVFDGTPNLPPKCKNTNLKYSNTETSFKQVSVYTKWAFGAKMTSY